MVVLANAAVEEDPGRVTEMLASRLTEAERRLCGPRATAKRRAEFLAGRLAAREAVRAHLGPGRGDAVILREEGVAAGRPRAVHRRDLRPLPVHVSLTHAEGLAVAAASERPLGLDLTPVRDRGGAFAREAFVAGEVEAWAAWLAVAPGDPRATTLAFAAKEAALKWQGTGLRSSLHALAVAPASGPAIASLPGLRGPVARFTARVRRRGAEGWVESTLEAWLRAGDERMLVVLAGRTGENLPGAETRGAAAGVRPRDPSPRPPLPPPRRAPTAR